MSPARDRDGARLGLILKAVLAAYVLAAALLPLGHHDIACHLKSSNHCVTCVVGSSGEIAAHDASLVATAFEDSGRADLNARAYLQSVALGATSGRSPPILG
jgi:hypothetical protein